MAKVEPRGMAPLTQSKSLLCSQINVAIKSCNDSLCVYRFFFFNLVGKLAE